MVLDYTYFLAVPIRLYSFMQEVLVVLSQQEIEFICIDLHLYLKYLKKFKIELRKKKMMNVKVWQ